MANGIKLRRGLKTALAGTIADGEFVFCTDSGELGFKKGTIEKYVDLEKLTTDVDELQAKEVSLLPNQFKISINKFYDFDLNPQSKPVNRGGFRIPIAKVNPLYIGKEFALNQVFIFSNSTILTYDINNPSGEFLLTEWDIHFIVIATQSEGGKISLRYNEGLSNSNLGLEILDDGYGNFSIWVKLPIDIGPLTTNKVRIAFDMDCVSEVGKDLSLNSYNVFLPPLGLEITPYNGAS